MVTEYNLLPWRKQAYHHQLVRMGKISVGIIFSTVLIWIVAYFFIGQNIAIHKHRQSIYKKKLTQIKPQLRAIKQWKEQLGQIDEKNCWIRQLRIMQQKIPHLLQQIALLTPKEVCVTTISRSGQRIRFSGFSQTSKPLLAMVHHFEQLTWLRDVRLNQVNTKPLLQTHRWLSNFTIEFTVRGDDGEKVCA